MNSVISSDEDILKKILFLAIGDIHLGDIETGSLVFEWGHANRNALAYMT